MLVYYISSHGFGHAVRSCEVIRCLPPDLPLTIRSGVPLKFFASELPNREFTYAPEVFDVGAIGPDSSNVDFELTISRMEALLDFADTRLPAEVDWLRSIGARAIVGDIVPFAFRAAHAAGLPSILIANFTWPGIYSHLADQYCTDAALRARAERVIDRLLADDALAGTMLTPDMAIPITAARRTVPVPLISRTGHNRRAVLDSALGLDPARPLYLLYLGAEGLEGMQWDRARTALAGLQIISYHPPAGLTDFIRPVPSEVIQHIDVAASVDAVIAKPGYGTCAECIANDIPLLYIPRPHFAEYNAIVDLMQRWGGALEASVEDFRALRWQPYLDRLPALIATANPIPRNGGEICAAAITDMYHSR